MSARDRECVQGVGKFCREREAAVAERRQILDTAMASVGRTADPQTDAAIKLVAWATRGVLRPSGDDFAMLRLVLLALLPQIGGVLLMVSRSEIGRRRVIDGGSQRRGREDACPRRETRGAQ
jgi:predicted secreted protein